MSSVINCPFIKVACYVPNMWSSFFNRSISFLIVNFNLRIDFK